MSTVGLDLEKRVPFEYRVRRGGIPHENTSTVFLRHHPSKCEPTVLCKSVRLKPHACSLQDLIWNSDVAWMQAVIAIPHHLGRIRHGNEEVICSPQLGTSMGAAMAFGYAATFFATSVSNNFARRGGTAGAMRIRYHQTHAPSPH